MTTEQRAARLRQVVRACAWWLAAQGVLLLLLGDRLAGWLSLRWLPVMAPYVRLSGLSLLALALFVHRGVDRPERQYLAVDTLLLLLLGRVALTLSQALGGGFATGFEWATAGVDSLLALGLLVLRTRSSQMQAAGTLVATDAGLLLRQTTAWIAGQGPRPEASLGPLDAEKPATPAPAQVQALWSDGRAPLMPKAELQAQAPAPLPPPSPGTAAWMQLPPDAGEARPRPSAQVPPPPASAPRPAPLPPPSPGQPPRRSESLPTLD